MKNINCLIVDDEPLGIKVIEHHITKIESLVVVATCNNALSAFEILSKNEIDLLFLDIKMPDMTGIDFLKTLRHPPRTIFTTAYREYAVESYDLDVVDYLLKPITFERFFKSVSRFISNEITTKQLTKDDDKNEYIVMKSGTRYHKIELDTIVYIESLKDYITFHTSVGEPITSKYKIGAIEQEISSKKFLRVHRSFIINYSKISAFTIHDIVVDTIEIPIGASYKDSVSTFLDQLKK